MDPFALTADALREPWRLWTCHLAHFGWEHALANVCALAIPIILVQRKDRDRLLIVALFMAPLLSLLLLSTLDQGQYRGASGLACLFWAWVGLRLAVRRDSLAVGATLLGGLALKLSLEGAMGWSPLNHHSTWQVLPEAHAWGALLGLAAALPGLPFRWRRSPSQV